MRVQFYYEDGQTHVVPSDGPDEYLQPVAVEVPDELYARYVAAQEALAALEAELAAFDTHEQCLTDEARLVWEAQQLQLEVRLAEEDAYAEAEFRAEMEAAGFGLFGTSGRT